LNIKIFYDNIQYRLKGWRKIKKLIEDIISKEEKISGDINIILTDDISLKKINIDFLKHNYYTDVISFSNNIGKTVNGEIYISIDTVRINSINYNVSLKNEITRVLIHGVLHLCGYEDVSLDEREEMKELEDEWLNDFTKRIEDV
jgi:probable rRNA maturation factor